jgi:C1A family cysteine protease
MKQFNLKPSAPDYRDYKYIYRQQPISAEVDLRQWDSLVEDQGDSSSCAGNAFTNCYELQVKQQYPDKFTELSRMYIYYNIRDIEGTVDCDCGVLSLRNGMQAMKQWGMCSEKLWPYDVNKYSIKPTPECYQDGSTRTISYYISLGNLDEILEVLNNGNPVIIGMEVYDSFMSVSNTNPTIPMPGIEYSLGGHAVAVVGYSLANQELLIKNSFGTEWGMEGYAWMPFAYVTDYVFERWYFEI